MIQFMRPNYDKAHRCPVWSGPAMRSEPRRTTVKCNNGSVRSILGDDVYPNSSTLANLLPGRCRECGTWTIPEALCWPDKTIQFAPMKLRWFKQDVSNQVDRLARGFEPECWSVRDKSTALIAVATLAVEDINGILRGYKGDGCDDDGPLAHAGEVRECPVCDPARKRLDAALRDSDEARIEHEAAWQDWARAEEEHQATIVTQDRVDLNSFVAQEGQE